MLLHKNDLIAEELWQSINNEKNSHIPILIPLDENVPAHAKSAFCLTAMRGVVWEVFFEKYKWCVHAKIGRVVCAASQISNDFRKTARRESSMMIFERHA